MTDSYDRLLWLDCLGGLIVGAIVLTISFPLSELGNLPLRVVVGMGIANVLYGSFSLFVTVQNPRSIGFVKTLAIANMAWLVVCVTLVWVWSEQISMLGTFHVLGKEICRCTWVG